MKRLLLLIFLLPVLVHAQDKLDERWYSLLLQSRSVGFLHRTDWRTPEGLVRSEIEQTLRIRRFGVPFSLTQRDVWIEDPDGGLLSVISELDMNGQRQWVEAQRAEGGLRVRLHRGGDTEERFLPDDDPPVGLFSADGELTALIAGWNRGEGSEAGEAVLHYRLFSPESLQIEELQLSILGRGEVKDTLGQTHRGLLVEERTSALPGVVTTEVYNAQAEFVYSKTPVGLELEIHRLEGGATGGPDRPGGDEPEPEFYAVFDVASLTIPVRGPMDLSLERARALTVLFRGQGTAILKEAVDAAEADLIAGPGPGSAQTRIVGSNNDAGPEAVEVYLENRPYRAPPRALNPPPPDSIPPEVESYLEGGFHLNLQDPRLAELLAECGAEVTAAKPGNIPICLERLVNRYIVNKTLAYGFAGLDEILEGRAGDCTEHALLLAALLRKAGYPSRLAYGLILSDIGFIGHAWVEVFTSGSWQWLDPSFPDGRPYGLKIRLGVMDPSNPAWASLSLALLQVVATVEAEIQTVEYR